MLHALTDLFAVLIDEGNDDSLNEVLATDWCGWTYWTELYCELDWGTVASRERV